MGACHTGLKKLSEYMRKNKFKPEKKDYTTKHNGQGGMHIKDLDAWSDWALDALELNNLMEKIRRTRSDKSSDDDDDDDDDFETYVKKSKDNERANTISQMMQGSSVKWWSFPPKNFAKVGAKQTKDLLQAYEQGKYI